MKITSLTLSVLVTILVFSSCKKDSTSNDPAPPTESDEQMSPASGKITHYLFNGNTRDTSGNGQHGGEAGSIAFGADRFNRASRALELSGNNSNFETRGLKATFPFSISFWMNSANAASVSSLFTADRLTSGYYGYWLQQSIASPNKLAFSIGDGTGTSGSARNSLLSSVSLASNQWYHIVINVRGANDMDLYINGTRDNAATYDGSATSIVYSSTTPFGTMGGAFGSQFFNGKMDDFRVYNRVLTATEIGSLHSFQP